MASASAEARASRTVMQASSFSSVASVASTAVTETISYHQLEITYSRFEKTIRFPCPVEGALVERRYRDGLLILHIRSPAECD